MKSKFRMRSIAVGIVSICLLVGCTFPDALTESQEANVIFNAQGIEKAGEFLGFREAEKIVNISGGQLSQTAKWSYLNCLDQYGNVAEMTINGSVVYNDWVTFKILKDGEAISISTKPNETGRMRKITFVGTGKKRIFKIHVYQD